jgi:CHAD domain-containing protein
MEVRQRMSKFRPVKRFPKGLSVRVSSELLFASRLEALYADRDILQDNFNEEALHDLRLSAKRMRYALEFFKGYNPTRLTPMINFFKSLQDCLGELHDIDVQLPIIEARLARAMIGKEEKDIAVRKAMRHLYRTSVRKRTRLMNEFYKYWKMLNSERFEYRLRTLAHNMPVLPNKTRSSGFDN